MFYIPRDSRSQSPLSFSSPSQRARRIKTKQIGEEALINSTPGLKAQERLRSKILLPEVPVEIIKYANRITSQVSKDLDGSRKAYEATVSKLASQGIHRFSQKTYSEELKKVGLPGDYNLVNHKLGEQETSAARISYAFDLASSKLGCNLGANRKEVLALTAFLLRDPKNPNRTFQRFPVDLFQQSPECVLTRTIVRYTIVNRGGIKTALEVEQENLDKLLEVNGISSLYRSLNDSQIVELAFPNICDGVNPPVRPWLLSGFQWNSEEGNRLAPTACAWFLEFGAGVYDRSTDTFNINKMRRYRWIDHIKASGLKYLLISSQEVRNVADLIRLGGRTLSSKQIFGIGSDQLQERSVVSHKRWTELRSDRTTIIDGMTLDGLAKLKSSNPELFSSIDTNTLNPNRIRHFRDWSKIYTEGKTNSLPLAGITPTTALKRCIPAQFGWGRDQLKPWDIWHKKLWQGPDRERVFQSAMAYMLYDHGLGKLEITDNGANISFSTAQLRSWYESNPESIRKQFMRYGTYAGFFTVASEKESTALCIMFGVPEKSRTNLTRSAKHSNEKLFYYLMKASNDRFVLQLFSPKEESLTVKVFGSAIKRLLRSEKTIFQELLKLHISSPLRTLAALPGDPSLRRTIADRWKLEFRSNSDRELAAKLEIPEERFSSTISGDTDLSLSSIIKIWNGNRKIPIGEVFSFLGTAERLSLARSLNTTVKDSTNHDHTTLRSETERAVQIVDISKIDQTILAEANPYHLIDGISSIEEFQRTRLTNLNRAGWQLLVNDKRFMEKLLTLLDSELTLLTRKMFNKYYYVPSISRSYETTKCLVYSNTLDCLREFDPTRHNREQDTLLVRYLRHTVPLRIIDEIRVEPRQAALIAKIGERVRSHNLNSDSNSYNTTSDEDELEALLSRVKGEKERAIIWHRVATDMTLAEIGHIIFGTTESRISQRLSRLEQELMQRSRN